MGKKLQYLTDEEHTVVLVALRHLQESRNSTRLRRIFDTYGKPNGSPLSNTHIDALCERLNTKPPARCSMDGDAVRHELGPKGHTIRDSGWGPCSVYVTEEDREADISCVTLYPDDGGICVDSPPGVKARTFYAYSGA